jgi:hypothetical protein
VGNKHRSLQVNDQPLVTNFYHFVCSCCYWAGMGKPEFPASIRGIAGVAMNTIIELRNKAVRECGSFKIQRSVLLQNCGASNFADRVQNVSIIQLPVPLHKPSAFNWLLRQRTLLQNQVPNHGNLESDPILPV